MTEAQESERRQEEFKTRSQLFIEALDVDEVIAHLLVTEGFSLLEEVAFVPVEELASIEGFDEDVAKELSTRAQAYLSEQEEVFATKRRELEIADDLAELEGLTPQMVVALAEQGIKTLDALGELAGYELSGSEAEEEGGEKEEGILQDFGVTESIANEIIVRARAHWFVEEDAAAEAEAAAEATDTEDKDAETKTTLED